MRVMWFPPKHAEAWGFKVALPQETPVVFEKEVDGFPTVRAPCSCCERTFGSSSCTCKWDDALDAVKNPKCSIHRN
jgi:hypothetical protein